MTTVRVVGASGTTYEFVDKMIGQGGMKDVYFSPDKSYVVALFRDKLDAAGKDRLKAIVSTYRENIFLKEGGDYWKAFYCWPYDIVEHDGRTGVIVPVYDARYFFSVGSINGDMLGIQGKEKEGKWFASASNRAKFLAKEEKGDWQKHLRMVLHISRAVRRMHAAGLAHSDLSYKNVLVDPTDGFACIIDIDGLVVPGKFPPDVVGTPDFIAPEVLATQHLELKDPGRKLPSTATDRHALAVLVYMYLLYRHPLRGGRILDADPAKDEELGMGEKALFIENPKDTANRVKPDLLRDSDKPWGDPTAVPYTITGPLLSKLFEQAFIDGLHDPSKRPTAADWEAALLRTMDLLQPCANSTCEVKWYVFDNTTAPKCPICQTPYKGLLPVLNLYSSQGDGKFRAENYRLMVWDGQSLFKWHANRFVVAGENLKPEDRGRVGYFRLHNGNWVLVNEGLPAMRDVGRGVDVPVGGYVELTDGAQVLLSPEQGGRLMQVQLVQGA
jgi:serine/threonine protein kinase